MVVRESATRQSMVPLPLPSSGDGEVWPTSDLTPMLTPIGLPPVKPKQPPYRGSWPLSWATAILCRCRALILQGEWAKKDTGMGRTPPKDGSVCDESGVRSVVTVVRACDAKSCK